MTATLIVALDFPDEDSAIEFVELVESGCDFYKVGLELFSACGPAIVHSLKDRGKRVFLDLKLHDIPNTVEGAARSAARMGCDIVTVHVGGGRQMLAGALRGAEDGGAESGTRCEVFGVSILTSLGDAELALIWGRDPGLSVGREVVRLAGVADECGLDGLVCSGQEAAAVAAEYQGLKLLVPGIRLPDSDAHDQARVVTPLAAQRAGADYLVLGRMVTRAADPGAVLESVRAMLR